MTQEPRKPINLAVHESATPSQISPKPEQEVSRGLDDLNDSAHDDENVDILTPGLSDIPGGENSTDSQISIANLSAG